MADPTPREITAALLAASGLPDSTARLDLTGEEPALPSSFRVGAVAQASIAASGLAAAEIWRLRTGKSQRVAVDMRHAAAEFRSERHVLLDGAAMPDPWDPIAGLYRTADGWIRLHTNFPHHRDGILVLLGCANDRESVAAALGTRSAEAFESEAAQAGMCAAALRDFAAWDAHPQAAVVRGLPAVSVTRIGDAPARGLPPSPSRPLSGVRVLDLTRVIAGPVGARTLAAHGADVLHITSPRLPNLPPLLQDTGRGKRTAFLDLDGGADRATMRELVETADVFLQSYRPGALAARGLSPHELVRQRPGLVVATLSAYGDTGPWGGKRGFDSLVQTATGFNAAEAAASGSATPKVLPAQALDHASGYLLALGIMAALHRRATEGGSWRVNVTLAGTGNWLRHLGRREDGFTASDAPEMADLLEDSATPTGTVTAIRHAAILSETPAHWDRPALTLGACPPVWMPR
jgi:crotonobetainyl-CoA:carnitine CoA-transferase CaiB-like acyl-CoA transferase